MSRTQGIEPPRLATVLGLSVAVHGALLLSGSYQRTYDAYVHMFFADHYSRDWFSTWDDRWYTGFTVVSYPPGTHQLMALLSKFGSLPAAFMLLQLGALLLIVSGVYRFSLLWVDHRSARWAALLAALSTSIAEAVHVFGQLPTTFSLGLLLHALPFIDDWLRTGRRRSLLLGLSLVAATTASHHVTVLFGSVFFLGPIAARAVLDHLGQPSADESELHRVRMTVQSVVPVVLRRGQRLLPIAMRLGILGVLVVSTLVVVVMPYWLWSQADPISQVPIPHASRENFITNPNAGLVFWVVPWGTLLFVAPVAILRGWRGRAWPLAASISLLALLGTGGTTPLPRLMLGGAFDILTLDRFTFWATIAVLPLVGAVVNAAVLRFANAEQLSRRQALIGRALVGLASLMVIVGLLFSASLSRFRTMQPDAIDPAPIAEFMAKDEHDRWRYLALGFGDQMAWVSAHTEATTVDGNYHSVRRLPELVSHAVERLEGAKYRGVPGVGSLQQFLVTPQRYSLKFVFSNDEFYDPLLFASGWQRLGLLRNNVMVWERADVPPLPAILPSIELPTWQRLLWGLGPISALIGAGFLQLWSRAGTPRPRWFRTRSGSGAFETGRTAAAQRRVLRRVAPLAAFPPVAARRRSLGRAPSPVAKRRLLLVGVAIAIGAVAGIAIATLGTSPTNRAEAQVLDYYDDVDFRRYEAAWARLDPATRPELSRFLLVLSVRDGLVEGYAKLDRITIDAVEIDGLAGRVDVTLHYLTSLQTYTVSRSHDVLMRDGVWFLAPDPVVESLPTTQFIRRQAIDYLDLGRRDQTRSTVNYNEILDRPKVKILDSRLVKIGMRWSVVGQLTNLDVDPADVTVTAWLEAESGDRLAAYDGGVATVHKVQPGETVPFRIDFEGVAGALDAADLSAGDFDPSLITGLLLDEPVVAYGVSAKALVTGRDLDRLALVDLVVDGENVSGVVHNPLVVSATIPMLSVAQLDSNGEVLWVDSIVLRDGIRPQRSRDFTAALTPTDSLDVVAVPGRHFDTAGTAASFASSPTVVSAEGDSLRIVARTFIREFTP